MNHKIGRCFVSSQKEKLTEGYLLRTDLISFFLFFINIINNPLGMEGCTAFESSQIQVG